MTSFVQPPTDWSGLGQLVADTQAASHAPAHWSTYHHSPENDLSRVLGRLDFVFQDIVNPVTLDVVGIEAHFQSDVGPLHTLKTARSLGMESLLARHLASRIAAAIRKAKVSVPLWMNVEPHLFADVQSLGTVLDELAGLPNDIVLELTERRFGKPADLMASRRMLARRNIRLALDDFRDTDMHWERLSTLTPDAVKINRRCIARFDGDEKLATRRAAILAESLRKRFEIVVQEGIETEHHRTALPHGVMAQGFYFGRPQPVHELATRQHVANSARRA